LGQESSAKHGAHATTITPLSEKTLNEDPFKRALCSKERRLLDSRQTHVRDAEDVFNTRRQQAHRPMWRGVIIDEPNRFAILT
jgi:hypothetical protein